MSAITWKTHQEDDRGTRRASLEGHVMHGDGLEAFVTRKTDYLNGATQIAFNTNGGNISLTEWHEFALQLNEAIAGANGDRWAPLAVWAAEKEVSP